MKDLPTGQARWQEVGERPERRAGWMGPDRRECLRGREDRVAPSPGALSPTAVLPVKGPEP